MGLFSWPSSASTSSSPSPSSSLPPVPSAPPTLQPSTLPADPTPPPPPPPTSPRPRRPKRDKVPSNAPTYILTVGGVAFTVGVLISVRQVRKLRVSSTELGRAAALAEGIAPLDPAIGRAGPGSGLPRVKRVGTSSILSPKSAGGDVFAIPPGNNTSAFTPPPIAPLPTFNTKPPSFTAPSAADRPAVSSMSPSPPSLPPTDPISASASSSARTPLFPPSTKRPVTPQLAESQPSPTLPSSPSSASAQPTRPSLSTLLRASRLPDPEEDEPPAPSPEASSPGKNILYAFGALGVATAIAVTVVGFPTAMVWWWLGVDELDQFRPALERKLLHLSPTLSARLHRADPLDPLATPVPVVGDRFRWLTQEILDEDSVNGDELVEELEQMGLGGTWGEWWDRIKRDFEEERRREERVKEEKA